MGVLKINTGIVVLDITDNNDNVLGQFKFNPDDVVLSKKIVSLIAELEEKRAEFNKKMESTEDSKELYTALEELIDYFEEQIDYLFGEGTSKLLFGETKTIEMILSFFDGITPYFKQASDARMSKYTKMIEASKKRKRK